MAIQIADGFTVTTDKPIDDRKVVPNLVQRNLIPLLTRYLGMTTFVEDEGVKYILRNGISNDDWEEDGGSGGSGVGGGAVVWSSYDNGNISGASLDNDLGIEGFLMSGTNVGVGTSFVVPETYDRNKHILVLNIPVIRKGAGETSCQMGTVVNFNNEDYVPMVTTFKEFMPDDKVTIGAYKVERYVFPDSIFFGALSLLRVMMASRPVESFFEGSLFVLKTGSYITLEKRP